MREYFKHVPGFDTEYEMRVFFPGGQNKLFPVRGFGVGLFAVRCLPGDITLGESEEAVRDVGSHVWIVDCMPTHTGVVNLARFDDALVVADEMSRFCPQEIEHTADWREMKKLVPEKLYEWLCAVAGGRHVVGGFRAFRDGQDPYLLLVANDLGLPYAEVYAERTSPDVRARRLDVKKRCFAESAGLARD